MPKYFADKSPMKELMSCYFTNKTKAQKTFFPSITAAASDRKAPDLWFHTATTGTCSPCCFFSWGVINRFISHNK